VTHFDQMVHIL